ncbi:MAG: hypothetical protein MJZ76_08370 [Bacteroidales bacterium]|nr:hypothetical protein [Bacteroidales bacterium]
MNKEKLTENIEKQSFRKLWKRLRWSGKLYQIILHFFALLGLGVIAAWAGYQLGLANNKGGIDQNNRYLADYKNDTIGLDSTQIFSVNMNHLINLVALSKVYPMNAQLIYEANRSNDSHEAVDRMLYAADMYLQDDSTGAEYRQLTADLQAVLDRYHTQPADYNLIPWMNDPGWQLLKDAILKDADNIKKAAELTGVDARLIVACTVGEQIRLFNSKREDLKRYLGPMTLTVQSQFSYGVNGIKDFTAKKVEHNLKDSTSEFYMGKQYEHILDFETEDTTAERMNRLTNNRNHLYSFIYTGCILHQTQKQWANAGYDISNRPDILCTLFNLGFGVSKPNPEPRCGGSHVQVGGVIYTFGVLGNDFFYSGELAKEFPVNTVLFK